MIYEVIFFMSAVSALIGALGAVRFPDFYTRVHALTMVTVGGVLIGLATLAIQTGFSAYSAKIALIIVFLILTSPASAHAIAHAAHISGKKPIASRDMLAEKRRGEQ
ncbi:MAG: monovalent cation/H(+) antiporter subunit G [Candidatus Aenigmarchaeota archaeon]|nr:monovalent cation/H(+) antiporter subunit G [Candidatus Aenigmarchaeota archaeon]